MPVDSATLAHLLTWVLGSLAALNSIGVIYVIRVEGRLTRVETMLEMILRNENAKTSK